MCAIIENPEISSAPGIDTNLGDACVLQLVPEITIVPSGIRALDQDATKQVIERLMGAEDECVDWLITLPLRLGFSPPRLGGRQQPLDNLRSSDSAFRLCLLGAAALVVPGALVAEADRLKLWEILVYLAR